MQRRALLKSVAGAALTTPYFFHSTIIKADTLTGGLIDEIVSVSGNIDFVAGATQTDALENDQQIGGGTIQSRAVQSQTDYMSGQFSRIHDGSAHTERVVHGVYGYFYSRFQDNFGNCCFPLGYTGNQDTTSVLRGAMTYLEGPNLVGLRALTDELRQRGFTGSEITNYIWPVIPSSREAADREIAYIYFESVQRTDGIWRDRDVLRAQNGICAIQFTHDADGRPDGGGRAALIVDGAEQVRVEFRYRTELLQL